MRLQCNKFADTLVKPAEGKKPAIYEKSCRFYAFPEGQERVKVHVDGKVDFAAVAKAFKAKDVDVTAAELKAAYEV